MRIKIEEKDEKDIFYVYHKEKVVPFSVDKTLGKTEVVLCLNDAIFLLSKNYPELK